MRSDTWCAVFWFAVGLLVCYGARRLGLGSVTEPGSGFVFFWSGLILVMLSIMLFSDSLRSAPAEVQEIQGTNWAKILLVLASLFGYALFLEQVGFVASTFVLFSFLLWISGVNKWTRLGAVAGAVALGTFAIFELWLKIRLPRGIFGF